MSPASSPVRFGAFELDAEGGRLSRNGVRIRLSQQPLQVLRVLLKRSGEVVTREELHQLLWPADVFVDFDHGLNKSIQKLREALGDSSDSPLYIETIPKIGYRFIAPVSGAEDITDPSKGVELPAPPAAAGAVIPAEVPGSATRWPWSRIALAGAVTGAVGLVLVAGIAVVQRRAAAPIHSLAVLPLENLSGDPEQNYFSDGMTDELITELAHISGLRVVSRTTVMREKGQHKPLQQIARELNVDCIVEGSVVRSKDRIRITAQLIDVRNDKHLWAQSFEGPSSDVLSLQDSVAREIAAQTRATLSPEEHRGRRIDPAAHDAYLRGRYFLQKREADKSAAYLEQAVTIDPEYSEAYAALAKALQSEAVLSMLPVDEAMNRGEAAARRALELDPQDGEAYTSLGCWEALFEWKWADAEQHLRRGVELSPTSPDAHQQYALFLDAVNRPEEAVAQMRRALELDPQSFLMNRHLGSTLYFARHYDEALVHLEQAREMEPRKTNFVDGWESMIYQKQGRLDKAVASDLSLLQASYPHADIGGLLSTFKKSGWKAYWTERVKLREKDGDVCRDYDVATGYLRMGQADRAFPLFQKAVEKRCYESPWMAVDPLLDEIRQDKRYGELLHLIHQ